MKIIYKGKSKKGNNILFRYPQKEDALVMQKYINTISKERTYIMTQGEQLTLKDEESSLDSTLKSIRNLNGIMILAFSDNSLVGISGISTNPKYKAEAHVGAFGISISKDFRGEGIGTLLMVKVMEEAEKKLAKLKIVVLEVFSNNILAISLYKKMRFKKYGILPKGILHKEKYVDAVWMYKNIK
jgi:ribosomal protein S18 acetylase RimI-like enzyme